MSARSTGLTRVIESGQAAINLASCHHMSRWRRERIEGEASQLWVGTRTISSTKLSSRRSRVSTCHHHHHYSCLVSMTRSHCLCDPNLACCVSVNEGQRMWRLSYRCSAVDCHRFYCFEYSERNPRNEGCLTVYHHSNHAARDVAAATAPPPLGRRFDFIRRGKRASRNSRAVVSGIVTSP